MNDQQKQSEGDKEKQAAEERIEVGYRNIGSALGKDYHHKFLLYTDRDGNQHTISAWTGDAAPGLPYGKLQVLADKPYDASNPDHPGNANATGQRQYRETITTGADLSQTWQKMVADAQSKDNRYPYDPQLQNSNTLADSVLRSAGLPEPKQDGFTGHWAPASGRTLDEKIEPKEPGLGNSGRSFSANETAPSEQRNLASAPETIDNIRNSEHLGNARYLQALAAIERSPNIPPGTFTGERLEQAAANLVNTSVLGADRPQGGQNERLDRIDFAVFNKQRDGLVAGQGELGNPAAKLAYLPAAQDNATTLAMASQQVHDTLQRTQAQTLGNEGQSLNKTQDQGAPSIGPRVT